MTLRVGKLVYGIIKLLPCLLAVLLASSCSSDVNSDEQKGNKTLVTLTIAASGNAATASRAVSGNSSTITRASASVSDPTNKDYYISDLTVLIFDESGDVIGSTTKQAPFSPSSDGNITIQVLTRAAKKCTVYAIANALALNDGATPPFAGVATLSALQSKVKTYKDADDINKETCLLMMGKTADNSFDTTNSGSAAAISLQRLASRIDFNFTVNNDKTTDKTTGFPIVVDSYQLCNVPTSTLYQQSDFTNPSMPSGSTSTSKYQSQGSITSSTAGTKKTYTCYVYTNTDTNASHKTYLLINAHSAVTGSDGTIYKVWNSEFHVNMPDIVKPNMHYTVNITINGGATHGTAQGDCGFVFTYNAYPYFSGSILNPWGTNENRDLDLQ